MLKKELTDFNKNIFTDLDKTWGIVTVGDKNIGCNSMTISATLSLANSYEKVSPSNLDISNSFIFITRSSLNESKKLISGSNNL